MSEPSNIKDRALEARQKVTADILGTERDWTTGRGVVGQLSGASVLAGGAKSVIRVFTGSLGRTRSAIAALCTKPREMPLPEDAPKEEADRFAHAHQLAGRTRAQDVEDLKGTTWAFNVYMLTAGLLLMLAILQWRSVSAVVLVSMLSVAVLASTKAFQASLANFRLRTRRLGPASLMQYLRSPGEWVPHTIMPAQKSRASRSAVGISAVVLATLAVTGLPVDAFAQTLDEHVQQLPVFMRDDLQAALDLAQRGQDVWLRMLGFIVPGVLLIPGEANGISNGIWTAMSTALGLLTTLACMMLVYYTVIATVQTAYEGKVMGQRWHQWFAPIRVLLGLVAVVPAYKGMCLAQLVVIQMAVFSGAAGNMMHRAFLNALPASQISTPHLADTLPLVRDVLAMEVCHAALLQSAQAWNASPSLAQIDLPYRSSLAEPGQGSTSTIKRGAEAAWYWMKRGYDSSLTAGQQSPWVMTQRKWDYGDCGTLTADYSTDASGADRDVLALDTARILAVNQLRQNLHLIAMRIVAAAKPGPGSSKAAQKAALLEVFQVKARYDRSLLDAAQGYTDSVNRVTAHEFTTVVAELGWAGAGAFTMTYANMSAQAQSLVGIQPEAHMPGEDALTSVFSDLDMYGVHLGADGVFPQLRRLFDAQVLQDMHVPAGIARAGLYDDSGSLAGGWRELFSADSGIPEKLNDMLQVEPGRGQAMMHDVALGHAVLNGLWACLLALGLGSLIGGGTAVGKVLAFGAGASALGGMAGRMSGLSGPLMSIVTSMVGGFLLILLIFGVLHAYILPMLPFIFWAFAVLGTLILVVECIIAAPLWAFMHVRPDGQELIDQSQRAGYHMVFSLLLRIPLLLFGYYFSMLVYEAGNFYLGLMWMPQLVSATAAHAVGPLLWLVMMSVVGVVKYQIAIRSFGLITSVPDNISYIFGASRMGDEGQHGHTVNNLIGGYNQTVSKTVLQGALPKDKEDDRKKGR
ncbi:MAG TPA: DotA/TraY family protein [Roseomonas sp.]|nr:DotA/TraY family protein [Roseomonas sp.]